MAASHPLQEDGEIFFRFTSIAKTIKLPLQSLTAGVWQRRIYVLLSLWPGAATSLQRPGSSFFFFDSCCKWCLIQSNKAFAQPHVQQHVYVTHAWQPEQNADMKMKTANQSQGFFFIEGSFSVQNFHPINGWDDNSLFQPFLLHFFNCLCFKWWCEETDSCRNCLLKTAQVRFPRMLEKSSKILIIYIICRHASCCFQMPLSPVGPFIHMTCGLIPWNCSCHIEITWCSRGKCIFLFRDFCSRMSAKTNHGVQLHLGRKTSHGTCSMLARLTNKQDTFHASTALDIKIM